MCFSLPPIPSQLGRFGFQDAGDFGTTVYPSLAGLRLLGRAVNCNCGRPALWPFLHTA